VTLPCLGGGPAVNVAGLRGVPTVVNVWGSWCPPCQREIVHLVEVSRALGARVRFLGVDTVDDPRSALDFAAHVGMHYPSVRDDDKKVLLALHVIGPPVTAFVRSDGSVAHITYGEYSSTAALRRDIARYLGVAA
jgi:thiol-disulfide isomerase/thioredoxin